MATNGPTPVTKYFWLATFQWPVHNGFATATFTNTFDVSSPVSRTELLAQIKQSVGQHGVPETANLLFLTIEPDQIAALVA
ncbi:hypothetical protein [Catenulispora pinisilvae]|uniref:hypothetical protein n=1 Tax=Catenulispora pinisilvae TaxID=2705253 RepID=UPI001891D27C|nr:hypothetical protein [Catenulispora pinisilvae]